MKLSKQVEDAIKFILLLGAFIGLLTSSYTWVKPRLFKNKANISYLLDGYKGLVDVVVAQAERVEGGYFTVDDGGALTEVKLFRAHNQEMFVMLPHPVLGWINHWVHYNVSRGELFYRVDEEYIIIYER